MRDHLRRASVSAAAAAAALLTLAGCAVPAVTDAGRAGTDDGATPISSSTPELEGTDPGSPTSLDAVAQDDAQAGVRSAVVPEIGDGNLATVPGTTAAPAGAKRTVDVAVQVEGGLDVDQAAFATFVVSTLNDPRSWAADGNAFARTDTPSTADVIVVLASPKTSADLCRPLITAGRLSCREGRRAILTYYRWINGQDDYGTDRTAYRRYVVNHEVGHFLGHGHKGCPGKGKVAPVMMQQTKGLLGCQPNPWPHPEVPAP